MRRRFLSSSPPLSSARSTGGVAPAFISTALSSVLIRVLFVQPGLSLSYRGNPEGMERMAGFMLVAMLLSSFIAALRSEITAVPQL